LGLYYKQRANLSQFGTCFWNTRVFKKNRIKELPVYIYKLTNMSISNQSHNQLHILMRSIILQFGNLVTPKPVVEVKRLNQKVVDKCTKNILIEIKQYTKYLEDLQKLPTPIDNPHYANKNNFTYNSSNLPE